MKRLLLIVLGIVALFCALSISNISYFNFLELKSLDLMFAKRGDISPGKNIIIASIDEKSLSQLGQWPWPRDVLADMTKRLTDAGARVVAFDVVFAEDDRSGGDQIFASELKRQKGAVLGYFLDNGKKISNISLLDSSAASGFLNIYPDSDGVTRRTPLATDDSYSFATEIVSKFTGFTPFSKKDSAGNLTHILIGNEVIPVDTTGRMMIDYLGNAGIFPTVSAVDIIEKNVQGSMFKDAIVLVGATAKGLSDIRTTPFSAGTAGIEIHASIVDNILTGRHLNRASASDILNILSIIIIGILSYLLFSRASIWLSALSLAVIICATIGASYFLFLKGIWVPSIYQVLAAIALFTTITSYRFLTEGREKRQIHRAFKYYLAPSVIDGILKDDNKLKLGGERREITILFSDVRNFTTISEGLAPEKLVGLMNEYFTKMTDIILEEGGLVDKYIGDSIMAFFGAPATQADQRDRSCRAAIRMQSAMKDLQLRFKSAYGVGDFRIGVGINTGIAYVGNMGSNKRFNYTAIGDAVNIASRLEGLTKEFGAPIIISSTTKDGIAQEFQTRALGGATVKGKTKEVEIFALAF